MDIDKLIQESISEIDFDTMIKNQVKESLTKTIKSSVEDIFRSYGSVSKSIEKLLSEKMNFDVSKFDIPDYRDFVISETLSTLTDFMSKEEGMKIRSKISSKMIDNVDKEMDFNDLWNRVVEMVNDRFEDDRQDIENYRLVCEKSSKYDWHEFKLIEKKHYTFSNDIEDVIFDLTLYKDGRLLSLRKDDDFNDFQEVISLFKSMKFKNTKVLNIEENEHRFESYDY